MLVLPAELTHDQAAACCRMLAQALRSQPESAVVADAGALCAIRFVGAGGAARVPARGAWHWARASR